MRTFRAEPSASILIESMRDIGYSLETALADVTDNAITARASRIELFAEMGDPVRVGVLDNGTGMSRDELMAAMRLGSRSPLDERAPRRPNGTRPRHACAKTAGISRRSTRRATPQHLRLED